MARRLAAAFIFLFSLAAAAPPPPSLRLYVPPWAGGPPAAGDAVEVRFVEVHGEAGLVLHPNVTSTIHGAPIAALRFTDEGDGWYAATHTLVAGEETWPWTGLTISLHLLRPGTNITVSLTDRAAPGLPFTEEGATRGITWNEVSIGRGGALGDVDGDGDGDIVVTNYHYSHPDAMTVLYINDGSGFFKEEGAARGVNMSEPANTPRFADMNNDGAVDLLVTGPADALLLNDGHGVFTRQSTAWDTTSASDACVADFNGDGKVDFAVAHSTSKLQVFNSYLSLLFTGPDAVTMAGVSCVDFDQDGYVDISGVGSSNMLWKNDGHGFFQDVSARLGEASAGAYRASLWLDVDNDGHLDWWVADGAPDVSKSDLLFMNLGPGAGFSEESVARGLNATGSVVAQTAFDFDNDGDLDVFQTAGGSFQADTRLYVNVGDGYFINAASAYGVRQVSYSTVGLAGDMDSDGDLDLFVVWSGNDVDVVYVNQRGGEPPSCPYLRIRVLAADGVASAFGSTVTVASSTWMTTRVVDGGSARFGQSAYDLHVAVPDPQAPHEILVRYPGGGVANKSTHPGLGGVRPVLRSSPLFLIFGPALPAPPRLTISSVPPAARRPVAGDAVNMTVMARGGVASWPGLLPVIATVNGANVTSTMVEAASPPGTYTFSWTITEDDLSWPWTGVNVTLAMVDPVSGVASQVTTSVQGHPGVAFARRSETDFLPPGVSTAATTRSVALGDVNGDGHLDVYAFSDTPANRLFVSDSAGGFVEAAAEFNIAITEDCTFAVFCDFDADGDVDLLLGRYGASPMLLLNGGGTSGFTDVTATHGFLQPVLTRAAVADIDGDGDLDVFAQQAEVAAHPLVFVNDGAGNFTEESVARGITHSAHGSALVGGDLDGDGDVDFALVLWDSPTLVIYSNALFNGDSCPHCFTRSLLGLPAHQAVSLAAGDVDSDGDLDMLVGTGNTEEDGDLLLLNDGSGTFTDASTAWGVTHAGYGHDGLMADLDQDGWLDVLVANYGDGSLFYRGDGQSFSEDAPGFDLSVVWSRGQAAGDLDGDGSLDVWVACNGCPDVLLLNNHPPDATFSVRLLDARGMRTAQGSTLRVRSLVTSWSATRLVDGGHGYGSMSAYDMHVAVPNRVTAYALEVVTPTGRWNATTHPALGAAVPSALSSRLIVIRPPPSITVSALPPAVNPADGLAFAGAPIEVRITEASGAADLVLTPGTAPTIDGVPVTASLAHEGDGVYALQATSATRTWPWDGVEVVVSLSTPEPGLGQSSAAFDDRLLPGVRFTEESGERGAIGGGAGVGICAGDVDRDGDVDFAVAADSAAPQLWLNDGMGTFTEVASTWALALPAGYRAFGCAFADADNDGDLDLAVSLWAHIDWSNFLFVNNGTGFAEETEARGLKKHGAAYGLAWCDLDGDAAVDLVVDVTTYATRAFFNGAGGRVGHFEEQGALRNLGSDSEESVGGAVLCFDADGDGDNDLLVANTALVDPQAQTEPMVLYYVNTGSGVFVKDASRLPSNLFRVQSFATADWNGDGEVDLLVAQEGGPLVLLLHSGGGQFVQSQSIAFGESVAGRGLGGGDLDLDGLDDALLGVQEGRDHLLLSRGSSSRAAVGEAFGFTSAGDTRSAILVDVDGDGDLDAILARTGLYINHQARAGVASWVKVRPLTAAGAPSAFGALVRVVCHGCDGGWRSARTIDGGSGHYSQSAYDAHFGLPDPEALYNVTVRWPGDVHPLSNWAAHPLLGFVLPSSLTSARRLLVVRPSPVNLTLGAVLPWDYAAVTTRVGQPLRAPQAGDTHTIPLTTSPPATGLFVTPGTTPTVNGRTVAVTEGGSGTYTLTFETSAEDTEWPWRGLDVSVSLMDSAGLVSALEVDHLVVGGTYENRAADLGLGGAFGKVCVGDVNRDGAQDFFTTAFQLWVNDGGRFTEEAAMWGLLQPPGATIHGCVLGDFDGDGRLDLYITGPDGMSNLLFMNNGTGFVQVADSRGVDDGRHSRGAAVGDVNADGDLDLFVCNSQSANRLYINTGGGHFEDRSSAMHVFSVLQANHAVMVDLDSNGHLDLVVTNSPRGTYCTSMAVPEVTSDGHVDIVVTSRNAGLDNVFLYVNDGSAHFVERRLPLNGVSGLYTWGAVAMDVDFDGDLDLLVGTSPQSPVLWLNLGGAVFRVALEAMPPSAAESSNVAALDLDADGDLDLLVPAAPEQWQALVSPNARPLHSNWLRVRPLSPGGSVTAHGATVAVVCALCPTSWSALRLVDGGSGHFSQSQYDVVFALPDAEATYDVEVRYPGGGLADKTTHLGLGGIVPALHPTRILAVRGPGAPDPLVLRVEMLNPWDTTVKPGPEVGDQVVITVKAIGGVAPWTGLDVVYAVVDGTAVGVVEEGPPGTYSLTWTVPVGGEEWPWRGLNVTLAMVDPVSGVQASLATHVIAGAKFEEFAASLGMAAMASPAGRGVCLGDVDGDGTLEVFVAMDGALNQLWAHLGDGRYSDVATVWGVAGNATAGSHGCGFADVDGDGLLDLFVTHYLDDNELHLNTGSAFAEEGAARGVGIGAYSLGVSWGDVDRDGDVDLFVCNHNGATNLLFVNDGSGVFAEEGLARGVSSALYTMQGVLVDIDGDGDLDLAVVNNWSKNELYVNLGMGTFEERGEGRGFAAASSPTGNSVVSGDLDGDGDVDLFVNTAWSRDLLFVNDGIGFFVEAGLTSGMEVSAGAGSGATVVDIEGDGDLDVVVGAGYVWVNNGAGLFEDQATSLNMNPATYGSGVVSGDVDNDGDLDIVMVRLGMYMNLNAQPGTHRWLKVRPLTVRGLQSAFGSVVVVTCVGSCTKAWSGMRVIDGGSSLHSQNAYDAHFGLPDTEAAYEVEVRYPGGGVANKTTHPGLGGIVPALHPTRLLVVRGPGVPEPLLLTVEPLLPWDTTAKPTPEAGDEVVVTVKAVGGVAPWTGLEVTVAFVNDVALEMTEALPGTYSATYIIVEPFVDWPWTGLNVSVAMVDPVSGLAGNLTSMQRPGAAFTEEAAARGAQGPGASWSASFADFDNDGDLDLSTGDEASGLVTNNGLGQFTAASAAWGVDSGLPGTDQRVTQFVDMDGDGDLDLLAARQTEVVLAVHSASTFDVVLPSPFASEWVFVASMCAGDFDGDGDVDVFVVKQDQDRLFIKGADGTFTEEASARGITGNTQPMRVSCIDYDLDGDLDVYRVESNAPNALFRNNGAGGFVNVAAALRLDVVGEGSDSAWGDVDGDGLPDLVLPVNPSVRLFLQSQTTLTFRDATPGSGLEVVDATVYGTPLLFDCDHDGDLDALFPTHSTHVLLYANDGSGHFVERPLTSGTAPGGPAWNAAVGDVDGDGDLDVYVPLYSGDPNLLFINHNARLPDSLFVRPLGVRGNYLGAGTVVRLFQVGGGWQGMRLIGAESSSQSAYDAHFGLPDPSATYAVEVHYVGGLVVNTTTHPGLGAITPSTLPTVADRTIVVRPRPSLSLYALPWDYATLQRKPREGNLATLQVVEASGVTDLVLEGGSIIQGQPVTTMTHQGDGVYHLTYSTPASRVDWPWQGLDYDLTLRLGDGLGETLASLVGRVIPSTTWQCDAIGAGGSGEGLAVLDANLDGLSDVFLASRSTRSALLLNGGAGYLSSAGVNWQAPLQKDWGVVSADFTGDGLWDIMYLSTDPRSVHFLYNHGGSFSLQPERLPPLSVPDSSSLCVLDLDADDDVDAILMLGAVITLTNNGSGWFEATTQAAGVNARSCTVVDWDGDSDVDVVVGDSTSEPFLLLNEGGGSFVIARPFVGAQRTWGIAVLDVFNDGLWDVYLSVRYGCDQLFMRNDGVAYVDMAASLGIVNCDASIGVAVGDADTNGFEDVYALVFGENSLHFLGPEGQQPFIDSSAGVGLADTASSVSGAFVDLDQDGDLDVVYNGISGGGKRCLSFASVESSAVAVVLRLLTRGGASSNFGATVRLTSVELDYGIRVVDGGHGFESQGPDVVVFYVQYPMSPGAAITARFVNGAVHNATTHSVLQQVLLLPPVGVVSIVNLPYVEYATVEPVEGVLGIGGILSVRLTAGMKEDGLQPAWGHPSCCFLNGRNVSSSFASMGNGVYTFTSTLVEGDSDWGAGQLRIFIVLEAVGGHETAPLTATWVHTLAGDGTPPALEVTCSPEAISPNPVEEVCLACPGEVRGCTIYFVNGTSTFTQNATMATPTTSSLTVGPLAHRERATLTAWAVDAAGNVGPNITLTWTVDLVSPVTTLVLKPVEEAEAYTKEKEAVFSFACSEEVCSYAYSLNGGPWTAVGGGNGSANGTETEGGSRSTVETLLLAAPHRHLSQGRARFHFGVEGNASSTANSSLEVNLYRGFSQGSGRRVDRRRLPATTANLTFDGLVEGGYWVEARAIGADQVEVTPLAFAFEVDLRPPTVTFLHLPPPEMGADVADLAFTADEGECTYWVRWGAAARMNATHPAWQASSTGLVQVEGLKGGEAFAVEVYAVDAAGNLGEVERARWTPAACGEAPPPLRFTQDVGLGPGRRYLGVEADADVAGLSGMEGLEYRLTSHASGGDGAWLPSPTTSAILLSGLTGGLDYTLEARAALPPACAPVWEGRRPAPAVISWSEPPQDMMVEVVEGPPPATPRLYASFALSSPTPATFLLYSLNGGPWTSTLSTLRLGPLQPGLYSLQVKAVKEDGTEGPLTQYDWRITSASSSALVLADLPDGRHTLTVKASDPAGSTEVSPRTFAWRVDTLPPVTVANLTSPRFTTARVADIDLACEGEEEAHLCRYCWEEGGSDDGLALTANCTVESFIRVEVEEDGNYVLLVRAQDGAGNVDGVGDLVAWRVDATPPNTTLEVADDTLRPALTPTHDYVTASSTVMLRPGASEEVAHYLVTINGEKVDPPHVSGVLTLGPLGDLAHGVKVQAVDLAGNVDPHGASLVILVDTLAPVTVMVDPPPPLVNVSDLSFTLGVQGPDEAALYHLDLHALEAGLDIISYTFPSSLAVLTNLTSGVYTVTARAEDGAGNVDGLGTSFVVEVDLEPPRTTIMGPPDRIEAASPFTLATAASEEGVAFYGRLVGGPWVPANATSVLTFEAADGVYVVEVRGVDAAGNAEVVVDGYTSAQVTVDATPPDLAWTEAPPLWTKAPLAHPCLAVEDLTPVVLEASVDGGGFATINATSSCIDLTFAEDGNYSLLVSGVDAAGHESVPLTSWTVLDRLSPAVSPVALPSDTCPTRGNVTVCPSTAAVTLTLACQAEEGPLAPCTPLHAVEVLERAGGEACAPSLRRLEGDGDTLTFTETEAGSTFAPALPGDGLYRLHIKAQDAAGNVEGVATTLEVYVDSLAPSMPPTLVETPPKDTASTTATFRLRLEEDTSPGQTAFWYLLDGVQPPSKVPQEPSGPNNVGLVTLSLPGLDLGSHSLSVWARDQAGKEDPVNAAAFYTWFIADAAPLATIGSGPANVSGDATPSFTIQASWPSGGLRSGVEVGALIQVRLGSNGDWEDACPPFSTNSTDGWCMWTAALTATGTYTLSARALFAGRSGEEATYLWTYALCGEEEYAILGANAALSCHPCPAGGDCRGGLTTQGDLVAQGDFWAPPSSSGLRYYACPIPGACLPGRSLAVGNVSLVERGRCAPGYMGTLCAVCQDGYFEQFGKCAPCTASSGVAWVIVLAVVAAVVAAGVLFFKFRDVLPLDQLKVGCSMVQIIASANTAYAIPWPPVFADFANGFRVFLIEAVSLTRASCAQPLTFYDGLVATLLAFKIVLLIIVLGPVAWHKWQMRRRAAPTMAQPVPRPTDQARPDAPLSRARSRRRSSLSAAMVSALHAVQAVPWPRIFRTSFLFLFVTYPGVSLKIMKTFKCVEVEGVYWLAADMRLVCYEGEWYAYATYAFAMACLYTAGLPLAILVILVKNRRRLAEPAVLAKWGFLYEVYGARAYLWEVEELLRKLWLSALVVLMAEGSPLQVTTAVLVSFWAHVLHALYKPWKAAGSPSTYALQHLSLFVTSFVFLMGLLFKVDGVGHETTTFSALAYLMVVLCLLFVLGWVLVAGAALVAKVRHHRRARIQQSLQAQKRKDTRAQVVQWMGDASEGRPASDLASPPSSRNVHAAPPTAVRRTLATGKAWMENPLQAKARAPPPVKKQPPVDPASP